MWNILSETLFKFRIPSYQKTSNAFDLENNGQVRNLVVDQNRNINLKGILNHKRNFTPLTANAYVILMRFNVRKIYYHGL